jgi:drug/metabolite transporter (DMT)-like permease
MLQNIALKSISPRTMSMVKCICPVMTAGFSFLILGERLLRNGIIGSGIILVCVMIQTWMKDQD